MLGDGVDVVDLIIASPPPDGFPPVAVLGGGEDDDLAKCPWQLAVTLAARHAAPSVAAVDGSRGYHDIFERFSVSRWASLRPGLRSLGLHTGLGSGATIYSTLSKLSTRRLFNASTRGQSSCPASRSFVF
jgi:hypothetical protein